MFHKMGKDENTHRGVLGMQALVLLDEYHRSSKAYDGCNQDKAY